MRANRLALMRKSKPKFLVLEGWNQIAYFLGQPMSTAQRWAKEGMPVERKGRGVQAWPDKIEPVAREPVQIATETPDLSAELRRGLAFMRQRRKPHPRI